MRTRKQGESVGEFVAQFSEHCGFGDALASMLQDRLVCGCNDHRLQCKLLSEENLTFDKALKIAKAVETAERDAHGMKEPATKGHNPAVHSLSTKRPSSSKKVPSQMDTCYRCGENTILLHVSTRNVSAISVGKRVICPRYAKPRPVPNSKSHRRKNK